MKRPQSLGIEYEILDLQGDGEDPPKGPAHPERLVDDDLAYLSSGLFDAVPKVEVPLDSFFPPPMDRLTPPPLPKLDTLLPPRFDSLAPTEASSIPPAAPHDARGAAMRNWSGLFTVATFGMIVATALLRPGARPAEGPVAAAQPPVAAVAPAAPPQVAAAIVLPATTIVAPATTIKKQAAPAPAKAPVASSEPATESAPAAPPVDAQSLLEPTLEELTPQRAAIAIAAAGRSAASCLDADELHRTMAVSITFSPSGNATRATIDSGPLRGTAAGSCIAQRLRGAVVGPFEGPAVTIRTSITVR